MTETPAGARAWAAVLAVTLGIFALMTSELLPVGLLTPVGRDLGVADGTAGLMLTVPGLVAAVSAPLITVLAAGADRRLLLVCLVGLVAVANLACAAATHFAVMLLARVVIGVGVGGFWAIAGGLAVRLVPPRHVGRATAVVFGGVSTASVLGVPAGTSIGDLTGWRTGFAAVGVLGLLALAGLLALVPKLPSQGTIGFGDLGLLLRENAAVRLGVLITVLVVGGHFTAYTFVRPVLHAVGVEDGLVGALLMAYGVAGVAGNFAAGARSARHLRTTLLQICVAIGAVTAVLALAEPGPAGGTGLLIVWGLAYGGVSVCLQNWMLKAAPATTESASSLLVAAFNLSIALGALGGGAVADHAGLSGALAVTALLLLAAAALIGVARTPRLSTPPTAPDRR
ncbi:MFS transporter [Actinomadura violacea]|nr:MFS transporter [Actinomadura violacea]